MQMSQFAALVTIGLIIYVCYRLLGNVVSKVLRYGILVAIGFLLLQHFLDIAGAFKHFILQQVVPFVKSQVNHLTRTVTSKKF